MSPHVRENRLFMGNPGTGKTTLINCLVGHAVFQLGMSWGGGLTNDYQKYVAGDVAYMDTPGLFDQTLIQQAAKAITKALSEPGDYKLFFMVRMQAGRLVPEDLLAIERVLDSIDVPAIKFSVLINYLGRRQYNTMMQFGAEFKHVMALINQRKYSMPYVCFIPTFDELEESDNQTIKLPDAVVEFVESRAPVIHVPRGAVSAIKTESYDTEVTRLREQVEELRQQINMRETFSQPQACDRDEIERERQFDRRTQKRRQQKTAVRCPTGPAALEPTAARRQNEIGHGGSSLPHSTTHLSKRVGHHVSMSPHVRENRLFMGNPGTGKSTLINCLVGHAVFQSGMSWGGGLTKDYQKYVAGDVAYMDTPGLADQTLIRQAAKAITKALSEPGDYKLFFMVRMQAGRLVSEDLVTIERVLDSIDVPDIKFSVLINNLGRRPYNTMMQFGAEFKKVMALMNQKKYSTPYVCFIPTFAELEESDNQTIKLPDAVVEFLESRAPVIHIPRGAVSAINTENFETQVTQLRDQLEALRKDHAKMMETFLQLQTRHRDEIERERQFYRRVQEQHQRETAATRSFLQSQQQMMCQFFQDQRRQDDCVLM